MKLKNRNLFLIGLLTLIVGIVVILVTSHQNWDLAIMNRWDEIQHWPVLLSWFGIVIPGFVLCGYACYRDYHQPDE